MVFLENNIFFKINHIIFTINIELNNTESISSIF